MFDEFEANSYGEFMADEWSGEAGKSNRYRSGSSSARRPAYPPRRPPRKPARLGRRSNYRYRRPLGFNASVLAIEPAAGENLQWVQECLNRKQGLELPVDGSAGPETRSAIRSFQRRQGLPVNGLLDAETEQALREFCQQDAGNIEAEPDSEIGPFSATLSWLKRPGRGNAAASGDDHLMTLAQAQKATGGGVYIMMGDGVGSKAGEKDKLLKVGKTEFFASRFSGYKIPGWTNLRVYIANIDRFIPIDAHIERALARFLFDASGGPNTPWGQVFPAGRFVPAKQVTGKVRINNILPPPLLKKYPIAQNQLSLDSSTTKSYEIAPVNPAPSGAFTATRPSSQPCSCNRCRITPCQCGSKQCPPGCSCAKCQLARNGGNATGRWSRQGNQIQVTGVLP